MEKRENRDIGSGQRPIQGQYLEESADLYRQAAVNAGLSVQVLEEGQLLSPEKNVKVDHGFKGIRVYLNKPEDADRYWAEFKKLESSSQK